MPGPQPEQVDLRRIDRKVQVGNAAAMPTSAAGPERAALRKRAEVRERRSAVQQTDLEPLDDEAREHPERQVRIARRADDRMGQKPDLPDAEAERRRRARSGTVLGGRQRPSDHGRRQRQPFRRLLGERGIEQRPTIDRSLCRCRSPKACARNAPSSGSRHQSRRRAAAAAGRSAKAVPCTPPIMAGRAARHAACAEASASASPVVIRGARVRQTQYCHPPRR